MPRKHYVGIVRDHSVSMRHLAQKALEDYNTQLRTIQQSAAGIETLASVVLCGATSHERASIAREAVNTNIQNLPPLVTYPTPAGDTPLLDAIDDICRCFENLPDINSPNVSCLIMVITDGQENSSYRTNAHSLASKLRTLQGTDRWTFTFRVPYGSRHYLTGLGIPDGNILEWEQSDQGFEAATQSLVGATQSYFAASARGMSATKTFYNADLSHVSGQDVRNTMTSVTDKVRLFAVPTKQDGIPIQAFVEGKLRRPMVMGAAFYQLTKPEKAVQSYKKICIRNKKSGAIYCGDEARQLLGLPTKADVKLAPGDHGNFDIFIQSMSTNRKLVGGTEVLYSEALV